MKHSWIVKTKFLHLFNAPFVSLTPNQPNNSYNFYNIIKFRFMSHKLNLKGTFIIFSGTKKKINFQGTQAEFYRLDKFVFVVGELY